MKSLLTVIQGFQHVYFRMRVIVLKTYSRISYVIRAYGDSLFVVVEYFGPIGLLQSEKYCFQNQIWICDLTIMGFREKNLKPKC